MVCFQAMVPAAEVREMAMNFATEKARLNSNELELKWERDFVIGKLLEREARHAAQIAKMQEHMLLVRVTSSHSGLTLKVQHLNCVYYCRCFEITAARLTIVEPKPRPHALHWYASSYHFNF
jgi:hypothetical protein